MWSSFGVQGDATAGACIQPKGLPHRIVWPVDPDRARLRSCSRTQDSLERVYALADKYAMSGLMARCGAVLDRMAPAASWRSHAYALRWLRFADHYALRALHARMLRFVEASLDSIEELRALMDEPDAGAAAGLHAAHALLPSAGFPSHATAQDSVGGSSRPLHASATLARHSTWHSPAAGAAAGGYGLPTLPASGSLEAPTASGPDGSLQRVGAVVPAGCMGSGAAHSHACLK